MSVFDLARVIVYRFHEKGLEIFLLETGKDRNQKDLTVPEGLLDPTHIDEAIGLEPMVNADGVPVKTYAVEGDWHDIPSIRGLIKDDVRLVKNKIKEVLPESQKGGYYAVKESFKKLLPEEYKAVKELKEILIDRNLTKYI